jgi:hypothetical protein
VFRQQPSHTPPGRRVYEEFSMNCYVFVHVPRTAGSSVWHELAYQGADKGIGVFDIYHESIQRYGVPGCADRFLADALRQMEVPSCLFHHHSRDSLSTYFEGYDPVFATLLRDPVDRFISDVYHFRRFFRNAAAGGRLTDEITRSWSAQFTACLLRDNVPVRQLLDCAARESCFQNFYLQFFATMCWNIPRQDSVNSPAPRYSTREIRDLAQAMRHRFQAIGWFGDLSRSFSEIQEAFTLEPSSAPLTKTINMGRDKPQVSASERSRFAAIFDDDYQLLDELRTLSAFQKSVRKVLRRVGRMIPGTVASVNENLRLDSPRSMRPARELINAACAAVLV